MSAASLVLAFLLLICSLLIMPNSASASSGAQTTFEVYVQKLVDGEKPKPGEVFEFEMILDMDNIVFPENEEYYRDKDSHYKMLYSMMLYDEQSDDYYDHVIVMTDENGRAVFRGVWGSLGLFGGMPFIPFKLPFTIREVNIPEGYKAANEIHGVFENTGLDSSREIFINGVNWFDATENGRPGVPFIFPEVYTINNERIKEEPPVEADPPVEPPVEIKPPNSGWLAQSFVAVAAVLALGYVAHRLNSSRIVKKK